ncbi:hypothetical protein KDA23_00055 [Candidatus Saccharibacteria bacterium]|nr:hypothetical protein [Candidatus Saccharibacteria bacterium]
MLDFDYSFYETKEKLIDEKLLKARNYIAHGEYMLADLQEALEIHEQCIELMEVFNNQVHQAASSQHFRSRTESGSGL